MGIDLRDTLPSFVDACQEFEHGSTAARRKWDENRKLLSNREKVSTLLEIPKLMETCVQNGNIDEALDLQTYVQRLSVMRGDLSAVQYLTTASMRVRDTILQHLKARLTSGIQLPECLSVVGHLRRLGVYSDRDLRSCFLLCREEWIGTLIAELDVSQPFEYLKRLTDIHRLHLFDVVMQYKAVFSTETAEGDGGMLSQWGLHRVTIYIDTVRRQLPQIRDGASVLSLLESSMYCGMSLGRVGLDFRHLLIAIFESSLLQLFKSKLDDALSVFSAQLETHSWTKPLVQDSGDMEANGASEDGIPPAALARHLPIALFANGFLSGLNELRHCAPLRGRERVIRWTQESLEQLVAKLVRCDTTRPLDGAQRGVFLSACCDVVSLLCPFVQSSLAAVYSVGIATAEVEALVQPLKELDGYAR